MPSSFSLLAFSADRTEETKNATLAQIDAARAENDVVWVNIDGLADIDAIAALSGLFGLHQLAIEDAINVHQRPKADAYDDHIFIAARMVQRNPSIGTEQVSIFLGRGFVLTLQERPGDCFDLVRDRLRRGKGRIRTGGADYLTYALLDAMTDAYFPELESYGETIEALEDEVVANPRPEMIHVIHDLKRDLLVLRRAIWPHREMINALIRGESDLVSAQTRLYLRDCYDHAIQLMDFVETYREIASSLVDVYLSSQSTRLNDIMKVLTIIATIFMPLGFIASLYGMNFDRTVSPWNMPELGWRFGYPFALILMAGAAAGLIAYFVRRRWINIPWGGRAKNPPSPVNGSTDL